MLRCLVSLHLNLVSIHNIIIVIALLRHKLLSTDCLMKLRPVFVRICLRSWHSSHIDLVIITLSEAKIHSTCLSQTLFLTTLIDLKAAHEKAATKSHTDCNSSDKNSHEGIDHVFCRLFKLFLNLSDFVTFALDYTCQLRQFLHHLGHLIDGCGVAIFKIVGRRLALGRINLVTWGQFFIRFLFLTTSF